jgi:pimeloyl-ACP methyl ester carboxylesterase
MKAILFMLTFALSAVVYASNPVKEYVLSPLQTGMEFDSLRIKSKGATLAGWWIKGKDPKHILIIAGSDAGNMSYSLPLATEFVKDLGWSAMLFDYRGFGASDSFTIDPDILAYTEFVDDIKAAVAHARKRAPKARIILWGRSLGASLAMSAVAEGANADQLIVESPYLPSQKTFCARIDALRKDAGSKRITRYVVSDRLEPYRAARKIKVPTHFIMGEKEKLITRDELFKLSDLTKGMQSVFIASGSSHLEFPNKTADTFPAFVKETIDQRPAGSRPRAKKR